MRSGVSGYSLKNLETLLTGSAPRLHEAGSAFMPLSISISCIRCWKETSTFLGTLMSMTVHHHREEPPRVPTTLDTAHSLLRQIRRQERVSTAF